MPDRSAVNVDEVVVSKVHVGTIDWSPISHREPLAYSVVQRTDPNLISRFTNPRAPVQHWTAPWPNREYRDDTVLASDHR